MNPRTKHVIPLAEGEAPPPSYVELKPYRAAPSVYGKSRENERRGKQIGRGTLKPSVRAGEVAKA